MSYFGNVSSFPCLEFTAAFSRNQAFFDARNDFPLFQQSAAVYFGHFAETFPISPGIPAIRTRPRPNAHVNGSRCAHWHGNPLVLPRSIEESTGAGAPRLPCVKGAVMAVSRKAMTEGLSEWASSDPLSPSVRTGAAPLGQQGEPLRFFDGSRMTEGDCDRRKSPEGATPVTSVTGSQ